MNRVGLAGLAYNHCAHMRLHRVLYNHEPRGCALELGKLCLHPRKLEGVIGYTLENCFIFLSTQCVQLVVESRESFSLNESSHRLLSVLGEASSTHWALSWYGTKRGYHIERGYRIISTTILATGESFDQTQRSI